MKSPSESLDFNRFEAITFDCYGTLINWEEGILSCLRPLLANHGRSTDDATILQLFAEFEASAEQGAYRRYREILQSVVRQFGERLGFSPTNDEIRSLPESLAHWKPWPDTVEALRELQQRFRLVIVSNVDNDLFAATAPQLDVKFTEVITAQQAEAYKPSMKIFQLALNRIGVPASKLLHVGQSIYHDVIPAQSLGMSTVWINRPSARAGVGAVKSAEGNPDLQVRSLAELVAASRAR
jgi:2-haloacid dehalogenase